MTKKDYVLIAEAFDEIGKQYNDFKVTKTLELLGVQLSNKLLSDNPRFDNERFFKACGFDTTDW